MKNWQWDYIDSVEAPDDYMVIFHLKEPWIYTEYYLMQSDVSAPYSVYGNFSDAAQEAIEDGDTERLSELLVGLTSYRPEELVTTGPFEFERLTTSDLLYVKRDEYWYGIDNIKFDEELITLSSTSTCRYTSERAPQSSQEYYPVEATFARRI
jgi:peptide/nickel transport system substrate-binding protein